ncbi:single-stranded DNA-binding protein [Sporolactobacillus shoreicorticis]|uniref:Single-stranded DNA-binding protein n=1 Tax=Sporolactobacillus shoreicorticis TaxID=1923877 RepID=A0ABW5S9U1_9BACL|nr:single-stranded DNA-binding protein [Sporolactobacillus shoreicorticis]MCO7126134.1 single-stranded DNA-binding protein [Sporolactobacillus shoreicorticis]
MINNVTLVGRLTRAPELRYTPNGVAVVQFTLAVNRPFSGQDGERQADFISVIAWRGTVESSAKYLKKGSLAGVEGRIQTRNYENNEGRRVYVTEVVARQVEFLEPKGTRHGAAQEQDGSVSNHAGTAGPGAGSSAAADDPFANSSQPIDISEDDLPF